MVAWRLRASGGCRERPRWPLVHNMTIEEGFKLIATLQPNLALPPMKRNKSWLFIFADPAKELHFYDTRTSPADALARITAKQPSYHLLDVLGFTASEEATTNAVQLRAAAETIRHYQRLIPGA